jgi:asparagine synthase (glutamine-hydrolysing)
MCGINGFITQRKDDFDAREMLNKMNDKIVHRGPDDKGVFVKETATSVIAMGMRRLSIIDIDGGAQPMFSEDRTVAIVFNGEIYNFHEIRKRLETQCAVQFATQSDTEVVLKSYLVWGENCLSQLNGMFSFSIYDERKNELFIARDRFGEKPLYYSCDRDTFVWASELKSLVELQPEKKIISREALNIYFSLTYIPAPYTIYHNVWKLKAGHYIRYNIATKSCSTTCYWDISTDKEKTTDTYSQSKYKLRQLLFDATEKRMISDVPIGSFLSGGVDSSIVSAIMAQLSSRPIQTFSIGYENKRYDESSRARAVAKHIGSEHHEFILRYDDLFDDLENVILNYDEPFADASCLPTYFVSKCAASHIKVALTGDGGDEVFGGYNKYLAIRYRKLLNRYTPMFFRQWILSESFCKQFLVKGDTRSLAAKMRKFLLAVDANPVQAHLNIISLGFTPQEKELLLRATPLCTNNLLLANIHTQALEFFSDELKLVRYLDKEISLEGDMLAKVDRASMFCSLECRTPYLDHRLMDFSYTLPDEYLLQGSNKKRILKDAFADLLPHNFFNAPKLGFEIPVGEWLRTVLRTDVCETLSAKNILTTGYLNVSYIQQLITEHLSRKQDHASKLWVVYCFQKWYERNLM